MQTAHPVDIEGVGDTHTYFLQGLGLYAARDIEKHTMVIEYIGTIIRNEVANRKEKLYESQVSVTAPRLCRKQPQRQSLPVGLGPV